MERTELREQFFAETRGDPYAHMIANMYADAWALGYEQALRDNGLEETGLRETHGDRRARAMEWLTHERRKNEARLAIALAEIGNRMNGLPRL